MNSNDGLVIPSFGEDNWENSTEKILCLMFEAVRDPMVEGWGLRFRGESSDPGSDNHCATLDKLLNLSVPQLLHPPNKG